MKKYILLILSALYTMYGMAQSYYAKVEYDKVEQPGLALLLPYSSSVAEGTIIQKLKEIGYNAETKGALFWKKNKVNGFYEFTGVTLPAPSNAIVNLYFDVKRNNRKKDEQSTMYLLVSKGDKNFISPDSDPDIYNAAKSFLDGFVSQTAAYKLNLDIDAQDAALRKAEKKLADLQSDQKHMHDKIEQLQRDIIKNNEDQQKQVKEIEAQRQKLEELKKQREF
jgi:Membrane-bound metallopeptidase